MQTTGESRGVVGRWLRAAAPAVVVLLLAPLFGEGLSGATPLFELVLPWRLPLMIGLYGCGALICREVARRGRLGLTGLCLLGAAYGVYEEGLVDRYWFYPSFWHESGVGTYGVVGPVNVLLATHLTAFHAAVSVAASVLVVERLFPTRRDRPWAGRVGLGVAAVALFAAVPFLYGEFDRGPGPVALACVAGVAVLLVAAAFLVPRLRRARPGPPRPPGDAAPRPRRIRRAAGVVAFLCAGAHFVTVYAVPSTGLPWPAGVAVSLVPVAVGILVVRRLAPDPEVVVAGILAFFVLLALFLALQGSYGQIVLAAGTTVLVILLTRTGYRRERDEPAC